MDNELNDYSGYCAVELLLGALLLKWQCSQIFVEVATEQTVLHDAVSFELRLSMKYRLIVAHTPCIVK